MSWPSVEFCLRAVDVYRGNNPKDTATATVGDRAPGRIDWISFRTRNPLVKHAIIRAAGSSSGPDPDCAYNVFNAMSAGLDTSIYVNDSPFNSIATLKAWWKAALAGHQPPLAWLDCETAGPTADKLTQHIRQCLGAMQELWPGAVIGIYTGAWWWNTRIVHGWERDYPLWASHYPYFTTDPDTGEGLQAKDFATVDGRLPIGNSFTPIVPQGWAADDVKVWQFSEKGRLPTLVMPVDLDYIKLDWYTSIYGGVAPAELPTVKVVYPEDEVRVELVKA